MRVDEEGRGEERAGRDANTSLCEKGGKYGDWNSDKLTLVEEERELADAKEPIRS